MATQHSFALAHINWHMFQASVDILNTSSVDQHIDLAQVLPLLRLICGATCAHSEAVVAKTKAGTFVCKMQSRIQLLASVLGLC